MMKPLFYLVLLLGTMLAVHGCANLAAGGTPNEQAIAAAAASYKTLDTAIIQTDVAIKTKVLTGSHADAAVKGLTDAKVALDVALLALRNAQAAAAASVVTIPPTPASGATK